MPSWRLSDAAQVAAEAKYTFYRPSEAAIAKIAVGGNVKLIFEFDNDEPEGISAERMWVLVDAIDGGGHFRGSLNNDPYWIKDLQAGDPIAFRDIHIINIEHDDSDDQLRKYRARCTVSARVLDNGERIGCLYREEPQREDDSGWCIFAGDETDDYFAGENTVAYVSLGAVLNHDDAILHLLDAEIGASFVRIEGSNAFVREED